MRSRLAGLFAVLVAAACKDSKPVADVVQLRPQATSTGDYLDQPTRMAIVDGRLVLLDRSAPMVHVFQLPEVRHTGSFGARGGGPGEFRAPVEVQDDPRDRKAFWIFDSGLGRITRLTFTSGKAAPKAGEVLNLEPGPASLYFQPVWLTDSAMVAIGIYPEGRLARADRTGRRVGTIGRLPPAPASRDVPVTVLQHAYTGRLVVSPDRTRMALATRHADQIEIYRSDGTLLRTVQGSTGFTPVYEVRRTPNGASMASGDDLRFGYVDLACTSRHIFALFSGARRGELPGRATLGREVQVYDWAGEKVATFELPERALSIAVDTVGKQLVALQYEPVPMLVRYPLASALPDL